MTSDELTMLGELGQRFHGIDLQFRKSGTHWPARWKATLFATKNERDNFRLTTFGDSAQEAINALWSMVADEDEKVLKMK